MPPRIVARTRSLLRWTAERARRLGALLFVAIVLAAAFDTDRRIETQLEDAIKHAERDLGQRIFDYQVTREFTPEEILHLVQDELEKEANLPPRLFLQIRPDKQQRAFDSRTHELVPWTGEPPFRATPAFGDLLHHWTFRYVDRKIQTQWNLRVAIGRADYLQRMATALGFWGIVAALVWIGVDRGFYYYLETTRRRHFDVLINKVFDIHGSIRSEEELIEELPRFIRSILGFDSVAIYLRDGERLVPSAVDSLSIRSRTQFLRSTDEDPITFDSFYPEARAARENVSLLIEDPVQRDDIHRSMLESWTPLPYVISPIYSPKRNRVIGLLTAERETGLDHGNRREFDDLARLVALLIEDTQNARELEQTYRKVVRQSRREALDMVVPIIAHNMRTPLTMSAMIARDLQEKDEAFTAEERSRQLSRIGEATSQCLDLIASIEAYRRVDRQGSTTRPLVDLIPFLENLEKFFGAYFEIERLHLNFEYSNGYRPFVEIDELELEQVVSNLLMNAEQAFPKHGRSTADYTVAIRAEPGPENQVRIQVADNGPGVRPDIRERIFDENITTKASRDNTGAGLPYCRRVVQATGGRLELDPESLEGRGAVFSIYLPTKQRG